MTFVLTPKSLSAQTGWTGLFYRAFRTSGGPTPPFSLRENACGGAPIPRRIASKKSIHGSVLVGKKDVSEKKNYAKQVGNQFGVQRKVSAANMDCNVVKILCGSTGMEAENVAKKHLRGATEGSQIPCICAWGCKQPLLF